MSVVRGMSRVGGACEMCMCLIGVAWMRRLVSCFINPVETWGVLDVCLGCGGEWLGGFDQGLEGWSGVTSVSCESALFV